MADFESTAKWKVDVTQFTKAMQEAKKALSDTNNEFKVTSSTMDRWSNNTTGLEAKLKQLNGQIEAETRILQIYEQAWKEAKEQFGETSPEAERLAKKVQDQQIKINKANVNVEKYNETLKKLQEEQKESGTASEKLNSKIEEQQTELNALKKAYADAVLMYGKNSTEAKELASQIDKLSSELKDNKAQMQAADKAADELDNSLDNVDSSARNASEGFTVFKGALANLISQGITRVISGVKDLARETFNAGANFEASMSQVSAISGATGEELDLLSEKAQEMGAKTKFSASEATEAFNYMAMAGWKTEDMLNGIEGIMNLAAASGEDLATTSDIVTDALTAMGYEAKDAGRLADVMAAAASNANTNVYKMGHTFQYAAPLIGAMGYSMEDAAVSIALMANAGIKGEKAGTALRSILTRLAAPPKQCADAMEELGISLTDSEGNMKEMHEVVGDLREAFSKLSETEQASAAKHIAGQEAMSGLLAIVRAAPEDYEDLTKAVENSAGAATNMANTMLNNVSGAITILKSKIEGIMIKVFNKMSASIRKALNTISKALDEVDWNAFAESAGDAAEVVAELFAFVIKNAPTILATLKAIAVAFVTYKAVSVITSVVGAFSSLFALIKAGTGIMAAFSTVMAMNPIGLVAAGIAALTVGVIEYSKAQQKAIEKEYGLNEAQQESIDKLAELTESYIALNDARNSQVKGINAEYTHIGELKKEYNGLIDSNGKVKEGYEDRANFILSRLANAMGVEIDQIKELIDQNGKLGDAIDDVLRKKQAEAVLAANEQIYTTAIQKRGDALNDLTEAQKVLDEAEKTYQQTSQDSQAVMQTYQDLLKSSPQAAAGYYFANQAIVEANNIAKQSYDEAKQKVEDAEGAWIGFNSTIQNYEGLSAAIISGDADKINLAMQNMTYNFVTAETGNRESLERQVENYETNLANLEKAIENGTPNVTQEMVNQAKSMVNAANAELDKLPPEASATGQEGGQNYADGVGSKAPEARSAGETLKNEAKTGSTDQGEASSNGRHFGDEYAGGVDSKKGDAKTAGETLGKNAYDGSDSYKSDAETSGSHFGEGFFNGIGSWIGRVWDKAKELAKSAWNGLRAGQQEGSPSKLTRRSGVFFGQGYELGIASMLDPVTSAASNLAASAVDALSVNMNSQMKALGEESGQSMIDGINGVIPNMSGSIADLKSSVASANAGMVGSQVANVGTFAQSEGGKEQTVIFNQTINSPKAVDRLTLYRQTNSMLFGAKVRLNNV